MKKLALVFALVAAGCGSSSGGTGSGGGGGTGGGGSGGGASITLAQFPAQVAAAICTQNFKCCDPGELAGKTMSDCLNNNQSAILLLTSMISDSQARGRATYSATQASACVTGMAALTCADWKNGMDPTSSPACTAIVTPQVAGGGACQQDFECTSGACVGASVDANNNPVDGMCGPTAAAPPAIGQTCAGQGAPCASGSYCDSASGTCKAKKAAGQACDPNGSGDECANSCDSTTSTCTCYVGCGVAAPVTTRGTWWALALLAAAIAAARARRARRARRPVRSDDRRR